MAAAKGGATGLVLPCAIGFPPKWRDITNTAASLLPTFSVCVAATTHPPHALPILLLLITLRPSPLSHYTAALDATNGHHPKHQEAAKL
jgi:hypothetical protein